jgi:hypothetical protein
MSNDLDSQLRGALRSVDPGEEFAQRLAARIANDSIPTLRSLPAGLRWVGPRRAAAALAASAVLAVFFIHQWHARRESQGLEARRQLIEALQVTGNKLDLAYRVVNDQAAPGGGNPGA